jgi:hypothetical protein
VNFNNVICLDNYLSQQQGVKKSVLGYHVSSFQVFRKVELPASIITVMSLWKWWLTFTVLVTEQLLFEKTCLSYL